MSVIGGLAIVCGFTITNRAIEKLSTESPKQLIEEKNSNLAFSYSGEGHK